MTRRTRMQPRKQETPFGEVSLTSRWQHGRYYLVAYGATSALRWMFRSARGFEMIGKKARHTFEPASTPLTVERELRQACAKWQLHWDNRLNEAHAGVEQQPEHPRTLRQVYKHHQAHYAQLLGHRTQEKYEAQLEQCLALVGDVDLDELTTEHLLSARQQIQVAGNLAPSTVNGRLAMVKKLLNLAHTKKWVHHTCWAEVPDLKVIRPPVRYWNAQHVALAYKAAEADQHRRVAVLTLTLGIHIGLRKNESANLRWCDLDLERRHPSTGELRPICRIQQREDFRTKTYENRIIPVSAEALRLLTENRRAGAVFVLEPERKGMPKRGGRKRVYRHDCVKLWRRVLKAAQALGAPYIEFKEMRHSFACACLTKGQSIERVARWLGHRDTRMVRLHYARHLDYDEDPGLAFLGE